MPFESDKDRLAMLKACGEQVNFNNGHVDWDVWAIYDRPYLEYAGKQGYTPTLLCRDKDIQAHPTNIVAAGTTAQVSANGFMVKILQPDGTGMTTIILEEQ